MGEKGEEGGELPVKSDIPPIRLVELELEAGEDGGGCEVEFCHCETVFVWMVSVVCGGAVFLGCVAGG